MTDERLKTLEARVAKLERETAKLEKIMHNLLTNLFHTSSCYEAGRPTQVRDIIYDAVEATSRGKTLA